MKAGSPSEGWGKRLLIGGLAVIGVLAAAYFGLKRDDAGSPPKIAVTSSVGETAQTPEQDAAGGREAAPTAPESKAAEAQAGTDEPGAPEAADGTAQSEADGNDEATPPRIEDVRIEADGLAVIAGRAAPGSAVSIEVNGIGMVETQADARGQFAAIATIRPDGGAPVLTLTQRTEAGEVASSEEVILAPVVARGGQADAPVAEAQGGPEPAASRSEMQVATLDPSRVASDGSAAGAPSNETARTGAEAAALPERQGEAHGSEGAAAGAAGSELATSEKPVPRTVAEDPTAVPSGNGSGAMSTTQTATPQTSDQTASATDVASLGTGTERQAPVAVLKSTEEGVEVLQSLPGALENVILDTIGYSDTGSVQLSGRAEERTVETRVYLDNEPVATLPVDPDGRWRGDLPEVESGIYTLRVDAVDASGAVTSRVETPFKRETPEVLAAAAAGGAGAVTAVTVQTGDTLWAIARGRYGEGVLYVKVFEANRQSIRNPHLIYPGQVFDLPD
ncbi:LysM peptidoglycan-binding domain-containing protein [Sulfitobacter sp. LCG007]